MENITVKERNKMALQYGVITGVLYIVMAMLSNLLVDNLILFYCAKVISYILYFIIMGILISRIKKVNGGFLTFKDAFSCVIIIVAIAGLMYIIYDYIFFEYINPQFMVRQRAALVHTMEQLKVTDDKIEQSTAAIDKQIEESKHFNLKNNVLSYFGSIILDSLFGLIVAVSVRKNPPVFQ